MLGEGMVSFGVPVVTTDFRNSKSSPKMHFSKVSLPTIRSADGVNSMSPPLLWKVTLRLSLTFSTPPNW